MIHVCGMTHTCEWNDSFMSEAWFIHSCDMTCWKCANVRTFSTASNCVHFNRFFLNWPAQWMCNHEGCINNVWTSLYICLVRKACDHHALVPHCNTLQHTETHCNALQHTATRCNTLQRDATHCNALQHIATNCNTHCNALQDTATHC